MIKRTYKYINQYDPNVCITIKAIDSVEAFDMLCSYVIDNEEWRKVRVNGMTHGELIEETQSTLGDLAYEITSIKLRQKGFWMGGAIKTIECHFESNTIAKIAEGKFIEKGDITPLLTDKRLLISKPCAEDYF